MAVTKSAKEERQDRGTKEDLAILKDPTGMSRQALVDRNYSVMVKAEIQRASDANRPPKLLVPVGSDLEKGFRNVFEGTKSLATLIRQRREELQMSQADVARALDIKSSEFIGMVENGHRSFELNKIPRLADVLKLKRKEFCRLALFEQAPQFAMAAFGDKVDTYVPETAQRAPQQEVKMTSEQADYVDKLYNLPSPLRYVVLDLIEKFTVLIKHGPSRLSRAQTPTT